MDDINMKPKKLVQGIGINDSDYFVKKFETIGYVHGKLKQKQVWVCQYYQAWVDMLKRCYSSKWQQQKPTYIGCSVADEWLTFSNFRKWMEAQNWEGKQLDKDILIEGNKVYGPDTCVFVTLAVNNFINGNGAARGEWQIGVYLDKDRNKFRSRCSNPFTKKSELLGSFTTEQEAHQAWLTRKLELAHELAAIQEDPRVAKALIDRYSKPLEQLA